jgi:hypothetical protein
MSPSPDPRKGQGSQWWWLLGILQAATTIARLAYEILRDHLFRR